MIITLQRQKYCILIANSIGIFFYRRYIRCDMILPLQAPTIPTYAYSVQFKLKIVHNLQCSTQYTESLCLIISFINVFAGGCALYGHSCYGGHGKRSELPRGELLPMGNGPLPIDKLFQNNKEFLVINDIA